MIYTTSRHSLSAIVAAIALSGTPVAAAEKVVNCAVGHALTMALRHANPGDILRISGTCQEQVKVTTDRITIDGGGTAVLDGGGGSPVEFSAVLTIDGAQGVVITGLTVQHGPGEGILGIRGSAFTLRNVIVEQNAFTGIGVADGSTATLIDCTTRQNLVGLDVFTNSAAVLKGVIDITANATNGANVNGRSILELRGADVRTNDNGAVGLVVGGSQVAIFGFTESQGSNLTAARNRLFGLVIATGSLEIFGGSFFGSGANVITSRDNGIDGIFLPAGGSIVSPFGTARFVIHGNGVGLHFENDSNALIAGGLDVTGNRVGLQAAGAGALTLGSLGSNRSWIVANDRDVELSFGTRITFSDIEIGTIACDGTVLSTGPPQCPSQVR